MLACVCSTVSHTAKPNNGGIVCNKVGGTRCIIPDEGMICENLKLSACVLS